MRVMRVMLTEILAVLVGCGVDSATTGFGRVLVSDAPPINRARWGVGCDVDAPTRWALSATSARAWLATISSG
jgi:hypothetical protein